MSLMLRTQHQLPPQSTGSPLVPSPPSRTKVHADHAGLSPPLVLWRAATRSRLETLSPFLSKNLSIVTTTDPWAALEVPWKVPSNGSSPTKLNWSLLTNTLARTEPAWNPHTKDSSTPPATKLSQPTPPLPSWPPSLSKLTRWSSRCTRLVFLTAPSAEPTSTTVSSPSDTEAKTDKTTTWSRTPGVHPGVRTDTSRLPTTTPTVQVSAESRWQLSAQLAEC